MPSNTLSTPTGHCTSFDPDTQMVTTSGYAYTIDEWTDMLDNHFDGVGIIEGEEYDTGKHRRIGDARVRGLTPAEQHARELLRRAVADHTEQLWHPNVLAAWDAEYSVILAADDEWYKQQAALDAYIAEVERADAAELQRLDDAAAR